MTVVPLGALDPQPRILGGTTREYRRGRIRRCVVHDDHDGRGMLRHDIAAGSSIRSEIVACSS